MQTIWKFSLPPVTTLELSRSAVPLTVQLQGNTPMLWVLLDPHDHDKIPRTFESYGTGHDIPDALRREHYIATFQIDGLVFHLFETTHSAA